MTTTNVTGAMRCTGCRETVNPEKFGKRIVCPYCLTETLVDLAEWNRQQAARRRAGPGKKRPAKKRLTVNIAASPSQIQRKMWQEADDLFTAANS